MPISSAGRIDADAIAEALRLDHVLKYAMGGGRSAYIAKANKNHGYLIHR